MPVLEAQCVYRGTVFFGTLEISGVGSEETVHVRYDGDSIQAKTIGLEASIVAPTLLRELVMEKFVPRRKLASRTVPDRR